jgi:tight adherence protein C
MVALVVSAIVFVAVVLLVVGLGRPRTSPVEARIQNLRQRVAIGDMSELALPFGDRVLRPTVQGFGKFLSKLLPVTFMAGVQKSLVMAGSSMTAATFVTVWAVTIGIFASLGIGALVLTSGSLGAQGILGVMIVTIIGFSIPNLWLKRAVGSRKRRIIKNLPDTMDLITTCVEAGLGLDAALSKVSETMTGPLAEEIGQTLREVAMGRLRREALLELGERTGVEDLSSFVNAIIQAEQMGASVGQVLKVQADQMRTRRRQRAEQLAHEAPVKMMLPLVLFIFPAFLLVILGPAAIRISEQLMK